MMIIFLQVPEKEHLNFKIKDAGLLQVSKIHHSISNITIIDLKCQCETFLFQ